MNFTIIHTEMTLDCDWSISVQLIPNRSAKICNKSAKCCNNSAKICNNSAKICNRSANICNNSAKFCNKSSKFCNKLIRLGNTNSNIFFKLTQNMIFLQLVIVYLKRPKISAFMITGCLSSCLNQFYI